MTVAQLQRFRAAALQKGDDPRALPQPRIGGEGGEGGGFQDTLQAAINQVDHAQKTSDAQITSFVSGEQENLHEVMIAMNEAQTSFNLMTEVRNRMLETYHELMRMQV